MPESLKCLYGRGDCSPDHQKDNRRLDSQGERDCVGCPKISSFNPVLSVERTPSQRAADVAAVDIQVGQIEMRRFPRRGS